MRLPGLAGGRHGQRMAWEKSLGTFPRLFPNPRPTGRRRCRCRGSYGQRTTGQGTVAVGRRVGFPCAKPTNLPACPAERLAIRQAQPASEGLSSCRDPPFRSCWRFPPRFSRRAYYSHHGFARSKQQYQLTPSTSNSIMCESVRSLIIRTTQTQMSCRAV